MKIDKGYIACNMALSFYKRKKVWYNENYRNLVFVSKFYI